MAIYTEVGERIDGIEAELRRLGWWSEEPPPPAAFESDQAFFRDTMAFSQWLQFVFIPRVREIVASRGEFPTRSMVGAQAVRELDGVWEADDLVSLLSSFDRAVESAAGLAGPEGVAAVEGAAARGDAAEITRLVAAGGQPTATAMTWAASSGQPEAVRVLLEQGVPVDIRDSYGVTPVFFAAGYGHQAICAWLIDPLATDPDAAFWQPHGPRPGDVEVLRALLDAGATFQRPFVSDLAGYGSGGATPLILAAAFGHGAAVDELVHRGAVTSTTDTIGRTAADWAQRRGHDAIAERLRAAPG